MKRIALIFVTISVTIMGFSADGEWQELFNGKNFKGWKQLDGSAEYRIENGVIIGTSKTGTPNSFMATKKIYGDFILEYEMKMDRGLNSGVQFRSTSHKPDGTARVNGYQVECDDHADRPWVGGIYEEAARGWLYPMSYNQDAYKAFKPGEWNQFRIEAIGNTISGPISMVYHLPTWLMMPVLKASLHCRYMVLVIIKSLTEKRSAGENIRILTEDLELEQHKDITHSPEVSYLDNKLTENQINQGWKLLWDGKSTAGWRGAKLDKFPEKGWTIQDGILSVEKSGGGESAHGGDIVTTRTYKSFILELDFRITEGANSGIKYFVDPELNKGSGSAIGCEYQILDDEKHPDAKEGVAGNRTVASLYDLIKADALLYGEDNREKRFNGVGSWNRARIEVHGKKVSHHLNGVKVIEYKRGTQMWKALVAYSKYAKWPAFGEAKEGHILLQDHGDAVSFKNIKILELDNE